MPIQRLQQHAASLLSRLDAVQQGLRSLLSSTIQQRLTAAHWPPPLAVSGEGGAAAGGGPGASDNGTAFQGFATAGEAVVGELQQLLVLLPTLQRASQHRQFSALTEASQEGPLLWAAEELAAPLAQRLRHHFAGGRAEGRRNAGIGWALRCRACVLLHGAASAGKPYPKSATHPTSQPPQLASLILPQADCPPTGQTGPSGCLPRPSRRPSSAPRWRRSCSPASVRVEAACYHECLCVRRRDRASARRLMEGGGCWRLGQRTLSTLS